jgi:hypothetical protein
MEVTIDHTKLSDTPLSDPKESQFAVRSGITLLAEDILFGRPTCYLISGYRGAGKTSFIKQVEFKISEIEKGLIKDNSEQTNRQTIFVYVNLAYYHPTNKLLRKLIRELYHSLKDLPPFIKRESDEKLKPVHERYAILLGKLYDQTFYDISESSVKKEELENTYSKENNYTSWIYLFLPLLFAFLFMGHMTFKGEGFKNKIDWLGLIVSLIVQCATIIKFVKKKTYTEKDSDELTRRSLYDDDIADYQLSEILRKLQHAYRVVFILDELDKQEIEEQRKSLAELKPYLVSGMASFVMVAGQDLYYEYDNSKVTDDGILRSLFARIVHVPLFSYEQAEKLLFDHLLSKKLDITKENKILIQNYCHFLFFYSRGVPRTFISHLRQNLSWFDGVATITISDNTENYKIHTLLNKFIDATITKQIIPLGLDAAMNDYYRIQFYRISQYILNTEGRRFFPFKMTSEIKLPTGRLKDYHLDSFSQRVSDMLVDENILLKEKNPEDANAQYEYQLYNTTNSKKNSLTSLPKSKLEISQELTNFRNSIRNVYRELNGGGPYNLSLSQMVRKVRDNSKIPFGSKDNPKLYEIFDDMDLYLASEDTLLEAKKQIEQAGINLNEYSFNILSFVVKYKFTQWLIPKRYLEVKEVENWDLIVENPNGYFRKLFIESKVRKTFDGFMESAESTLLRFSTEQTKDDFLFLVLFLEEGNTSLKRHEIQFERALNEITGISEIKDRIQLCVVQVNNLPLLDGYINQFIKKYISDERVIDLRNQPPPATHPERNDEYIEEIFEIINTDFLFNIQPDNTGTWRFGLTFSKDRQFPPIAQGRHADHANYGYVHLCVGDYNEKEKKWKYPELLKLNIYPEPYFKIDPMNGEWNGYNGEEVYFSVSVNHNSLAAFHVKVNNTTILDCRIGLNSFKYCKVSAWRDYDHFHLNGKMQIVRTPPPRTSLS